MQIGMFAKTFPGSEPAGVLAAVRDAGFAVTQFNLACAGLPSMPDEVPAEAIAAIACRRRRFRRRPRGAVGHLQHGASGSRRCATTACAGWRS